MNNLQKIFIYIIIFFSLIGTFKVFEKVKILTTASDKNKIINDYAKKLKRSDILVVNLSGRGDKDMQSVAKADGINF